MFSTSAAPRRKTQTSTSPRGAVCRGAKARRGIQAGQASGARPSVAACKKRRRVTVIGLPPPDKGRFLVFAPTTGHTDPRQAGIKKKIKIHFINFYFPLLP